MYFPAVRFSDNLSVLRLKLHQYSQVCYLCLWRNLAVIVYKPYSIITSIVSKLIINQQDFFLRKATFSLSGSLLDRINSQKTEISLILFLLFHWHKRTNKCTIICVFQELSHTDGHTDAFVLFWPIHFHSISRSAAACYPILTVNCVPEAGTTLRAARHTYSHTLYVNQKHTLVSLSLSHAHTHKRKTHSGQKNFEESAEWFVQQLDPLRDSHHQFPSAHTHTHNQKVWTLDYCLFILLL